MGVYSRHHADRFTVYCGGVTYETPGTPGHVCVRSQSRLVAI
jgi:hypothetical protein